MIPVQGTKIPHATESNQKITKNKRKQQKRQNVLDSILHQLSSFSVIQEYCSVVWTCHSLFNHSPIYGQLGCFHDLAIENNTVMNMRLQITFSFLLRYLFILDILRSETDGSYSNYIFNCLRKLRYSMYQSAFLLTGYTLCSIFYLLTF